MENRTARLTLLIDPEKKELFEQFCAEEDITPSQKIRQFIRTYIDEHALGAADNAQRRAASRG
jgi:antitoxin component of RelBE/YafQ-DinJ toxin-antitoxin module